MSETKGVLTRQSKCVYEMIKNTQALRVISTVAKNVSRGNTRGNRDEDPNENIHQTLVKRRKIKK